MRRRGHHVRRRVFGGGFRKHRKSRFGKRSFKRRGFGRKRGSRRLSRRRKVNVVSRFTARGYELPAESTRFFPFTDLGGGGNRCVTVAADTTFPTGITNRITAITTNTYGVITAPTALTSAGATVPTHLDIIGVYAHSLGQINRYGNPPPEWMSHKYYRLRRVRMYFRPLSTLRVNTTSSVVQAGSLGGDFAFTCTRWTGALGSFDSNGTPYSAVDISEGLTPWDAMMNRPNHKKAVKRIERFGFGRKGASFKYRPTEQYVEFAVQSNDGFSAGPADVANNSANFRFRRRYARWRPIFNVVQSAAAGALIATLDSTWYFGMQVCIRRNSYIANIGGGTYGISSCQVRQFLDVELKGQRQLGVLGDVSSGSFSFNNFY